MIGESSWKRVFLSCYWHEIYRVEAVGLESSNYSLKKLQFLWICEIWGNFLNNRYFANYCLIKVRISEFFCILVTHIIVVVFCTANFVSSRILVNFRFPFPILRFCFCFVLFSFLLFVFSAKSPSVTQRTVSQANAKAQIILLL